MDITGPVLTVLDLLARHAVADHEEDGHHHLGHVIAQNLACEHNFVVLTAASVVPADVTEDAVAGPRERILLTG